MLFCLALRLSLFEPERRPSVVSSKEDSRRPSEVLPLDASMLRFCLWSVPDSECVATPPKRLRSSAVEVLEAWRETPHSKAPTPVTLYSTLGQRSQGRLFLRVVVWLRPVCVCLQRDALRLCPCCAPAVLVRPRRARHTRTHKALFPAGLVKRFRSPAVVDQRAWGWDEVD